MFVWDSIDMTESGKKKSTFRKSLMQISQKFHSEGDNWPRTDYKMTDLNPKWKGTEISLSSTSEVVNTEAMLYVVVYDFDLVESDDLLGTLPLSIKELVSMESGEARKEHVFDRPLERY